MEVNTAHQDAAEPVSPIERLDGVTLFGTPKMWVGLLGLVALLIAGLIWGVFAKAPVTISAAGVISTEGGPLEVGASLNGTVTSLFVTVGESVEASNTLAIITDDQGLAVRVRTPVSGIVTEISTQVGDFLSAGSTVMTLQDTTNDLESIAFIPVSSIGSLLVGQEVLMSPKSVPVSEFGYLKGTISSISSVPVSNARVEQLVGRVAGSKNYDAQGEPIVEVRIRVSADSATPSGFTWTQGEGPPYQLLSGTPWSGEVVISDSTPIATLLGS